MAKDFVRIWVEEDVLEVSKHLLIVGESFSDCANCRELGLDFTTAKSCPQCKNEFKYVSSRQAGAAGSSNRFYWLRKIKEKRPELKFVDFDDFQKILGKIKARDIFK